MSLEILERLYKLKPKETKILLCMPLFINQMFYYGITKDILENCLDDLEDYIKNSSLEHEIKQKLLNKVKYKIREDKESLSFWKKAKKSTKKELTCLRFAVSDQFIKFISHPACQKSFTDFWYSELLPRHDQIFNTTVKVSLFI